nr:reverse transcriptase domain-containing protein [Tanacetum cinerariifolium]
MNFMIVRSLSLYNGIIGRPRIRAIQAVPSTVHGMLKFLIEGGIVTIRSTVLIPTECTSVITSSAVSRVERTRPANCKVALHPDFLDQEVAIEGMLSDKGRTELCSILRKNLDIFALQPFDMTGVPRGPKTGGGRHHERDLNKACPQDCYPLLEIDWKVESLCGYPFKCFLDTYKGYHQIQLAKPDEEKTTFHTGRNIEVYVDDLVVKSYTEAEMMRDIEETFRTLRKVNMKLNPKKCSFGLAEGMFLGYVVTPEGIKQCPDKTGAVLQLPSPRTIKEFAASNNEAEYEALIAGLRIAEQMGVKDVYVSIDSKLVANQVIGTYVAKEDNMVKDARDMIRKCNNCQIHRPITRSPQQPLTLITALWPFYKWVIDIAGPFLEGPGKVKFLIVAMDYFTKWIEAKAVAIITGGQSNGLVERANRYLGEGIKSRLVIPTEIGMPIYHTAAVDVVRGVTFKPDDFVYRGNDASHAVAGKKRGPKWEGPYEVTEALGDGAYKLRSRDGTIHPRTWNIANLKRCYL